MTDSTVSRYLMTTALGAALVLEGGATACKKFGHANGEVTRNWTPPKQDWYMGNPAAEVNAAIVERLAGKAPAPLTADQWKHVGRLYATFGVRPLWIDKTGHQPRVRALLNSLASADSDALRLDAYPLGELSAALAAVDSGDPTIEQLANADVLLSSAFAAYGENMLVGQVNPARVGQSWHIDTQEAKLDSALTLTLRSDDLAAGLARMRPQDPAYDSLRVALERYRTIVAHGGWPTIPHGGDSRGRLAAVRARLRMEGYLTDSATLAGAVASFQARHGIVVDGMLGRETVDAMNLPADYRLSQIAANLERYRWLPRDLGSRYIVVNVPQFYLHAYDSGQKVLDMKVIVGQEYEDKATPVFSDSMEFVIFRPYWDVTPEIAAKEIFPIEARNPGYLAANDMEVYNDHGREAIRQRPGPRNALGYVKFMFPNDYNIYLHDTPNHALFHKEVRAFSHGCIRVEKPAELAQWVLGWPAARVAAAMHGENDHTVNLPQKIPVYIVYFTAYIDDGQLGFGNDLYDRDSRLLAQLRGAGAPSLATLQARAVLREMSKD